MIEALALIDRVSQQYRRDIEGFQAHLRDIVAQGGQISRMRESMRSLRAQLVPEIAPFDADQLQQFVHALADQAERDAGAPIPDKPAATFYEGAAVEALGVAEKVRDALKADELSALAAVRRQQLEALLGRQSSPAQFTRPDRAGKRWQSSVYVTTAVRELGVNTYTNAFLLSLVYQGVDIASIDGTTFTINGMSPGMPTLADVEGRMHPNAQTLVTRG